MRNWVPRCDLPRQSTGRMASRSCSRRRRLTFLIAFRSNYRGVLGSSCLVQLALGVDVLEVRTDVFDRCTEHLGGLASSTIRDPWTIGVTKPRTGAPPYGCPPLAHPEMLEDTRTKPTFL
jgi:hypothetical protein